MKTFATLFFLVVSLAGARPGVAADVDPRLGVWTLNLAKSTYDPGPAPKSQTRTYAVFEGDGTTYTQETVGTDGSRTTLTYRAHHDGKDYSWTGNANADTIAQRRIDALRFENVQKKAGQVVQTGTIVVSPDGRTLTATQTSPAGAARRVNNVLVFDKQ